MAHPTTDPEEQPVSTTLESPPAEETSGTLLADLTPEEMAEYQSAVENYNEGNPLTVSQLTMLFGVKSNTIYAAGIGDPNEQPSTELIPGNFGDNTFDPAEVIPWGIKTGRLQYVKETRTFRRRRVSRLIWPGKPRGPHRKSDAE